jgi:hypothetical protein
MLCTIEFVTVGVKHIYFWTFNENGLTKRKGEVRGDEYRLQVDRLSFS